MSIFPIFENPKRMNKPVTYNKAVIPNSPIAIVDLQNNDNQAIVNSTIMIAELKDCKPMGVATYKTTAEMPEELRKDCRTLRN